MRQPACRVFAICKRICMYVCMHIYIYIYIYIHMYMIYGNINMHIIQGLGVRAAQDLSIR